MNWQAMSDEELGMHVAANAPGDAAHASFDELFERHELMTERFIAARISPSLVSDLHQKLWLRAWDRAELFREGSKYRAWLLTIARNLITDEFRSRARKAAQALPENGDLEPATEDLPDRQLIAEDESMALAGCLDLLEATAATVVRSRLKGESYDQICTELQITTKTAHKQFFDAKADLQDCLRRKLA